MDEFIKKRIADLRKQKKVSARVMSLAIGQNEAYITQVEKGHMLPSLPVLSNICSYFGITIHEFFDKDTQYPIEIETIIDNLKQLDSDELMHVAAIVKSFASNKRN